ncbi:uncharacterized protein LOC136038982 [Artemia franciscana]|uniref:uncharacterized protein LOC136038982 n=1 Tax=Artemia franciscana TaxID=6661 RepID=UPI0032DBB0DA
MLTLLYQIIFVVGIVPDVFCRGQLTPILKKGKPANICSSYRPITVSPVLCKVFEMLILPNVRNCCQMPNYQFGFTVCLGCADALFTLAAILSDSEATGDPLVTGSFDVSRAFDSSVHAQILLEAYKQVLNLCIVRAMYYMYNNLRVQIKIPSCPTESVIVPVRKGVRQGSVVSLTLYNNSVLLAQAQVATSCVSKGIDVSLMAYADDLLNLNRDFNLNLLDPFGLSSELALQAFLGNSGSWLWLSSGTPPLICVPDQVTETSQLLIHLMMASVSKKDFEDFEVSINAKLMKLDKLDIILANSNELSLKFVSLKADEVIKSDGIERGKKDS